MADSQQNGMIMAEPPHSIAQASVDEKGRLKLPAEFLEYLEALKVTKVFITTFDQRQARIYPIAVWKVNEALFQSSGENAGAAERREVLDLENQPVWLDVYHGRINVVSKKIHDERMQLAQASMAEDLKTL